MLPGATKILSLLSHKLSWLSAKAQTHTQNIAQADTPNYKRDELKDFVSVLKNHAGQIRSHSATHIPVLRVDSKKDVTHTRDEVAKEWEVMNITESTLEYQAGIQLMRKYLAMYKTVLGKMQ